MKPRLMIKDRKMENEMMFFFPNDDNTRQMQGCLNKNTLIQNNAKCFLKFIHEKDIIILKDHNNNEIGRYNLITLEDKTKPFFDINKELTKVIEKERIK
jgi:hypothetical protein